MNLGLFGVGKAGMSVVESLIATDSHDDIELVDMAIAFDTDQSTLEELDILPQQYYLNTLDAAWLSRSLCVDHNASLRYRDSRSSCR